MKKPTVIDLFSGAGGLSTGFKLAGYEIIAANEYEKVFAETYSKNHKSTNMVIGDIRNIATDEFIKLAKIDKNVDVIIGGPPCQGFSMAGRRDKNDPRNSLFMDYLRYVEAFKPKFFVMENVPGILTMKTSEKKLVKDIILDEFEKIGYTVKIKKLLAADYGVPQKRRRVFFIGSNIKKNFDFPEPTHSKNPFINIYGKEIKKWIGVKEILSKKEEIDKSYFHSKKMIEGFIRRKEENKKKGRGFGWQILNLDEPSYTISARYYKDGSDALIRYSDDEVRMLTEREASLIQSFPIDYEFSGSKQKVYTQIGNAVPVKLAKSIAIKILEYL